MKTARPDEKGLPNTRRPGLAPAGEPQQMTTRLLERKVISRRAPRAAGGVVSRQAPEAVGGVVRAALGCGTNVCSL